MDGHDDHGLYGTPGSGSKTRSPSRSSQAAAERLRQATQAVQARVIASMQQEAAQEAEHTPPSGPGGTQKAYPYDRPAASSSSQPTQRPYPYDRPTASPAASSSSSSSSPSSASQPTQRPYPYDRPTASPAPGAAEEALSARSILQQAREQAKQAVQSVPGVAQASAQRDKEARMLSDMFRAVWPDLGAFKAWGSATRVASMSGSLSLSVAFFGFVYWMSTRYDQPPRKPQDEHKS